MRSSLKPHLGMHNRVPLKRNPDMEWTVGVARTLDKDLLEVFILGIHLFHNLKPKYFSLQGRKEKVPPRKGIRTLVHLAELMVDHKME